MISLKQLEAKKLRAEDLKGLFTAEEKSEEIKKLIRLIADRIEAGRTRNLRDWRVYMALDAAYDAPYAQLTPTLARYLEQKCSAKRGKMEYEDTVEMLESFGVPLEDLFTEAKNSKGEVIGLLPNAPSFVKVVVPLVRAYVGIRLSKLFTDRDQTPLFKYEPLKMTSENQIKCEILTDIASAMTAHFGYGSDLRNAIFHTLLYGLCIMFPKEAWYKEESEDDEGNEYVTKEGLRYHRPHPTRVFYDLHHPLSTINTDTGVSYGGYWSILRYADLCSSSHYWNTDAVTYGQDWFSKRNAKYYLQEYYSTAMKFPEYGNSRESDRESRADAYTESDHDKAVFVANVFMKMAPKLYGLGEHDKPVWFRFIVASDDTVLYAEPLTYSPMIYFGYDADDERDRNASLGLELVPFQDVVGNTLSQILLTAKQNLSNLTFFDEFTIDKDAVLKLQNSGEASLRANNYIAYNSGKVGRGTQGNPKDAVHTVQLGKNSTAELVGSLTTLIGIMERTLQFSAQEVGSAASHQQSAQEIRVIATNTSVRVAYTGAFIDDAIDAWKRQIYQAASSYMTGDFISQVSIDIPDLENVLGVMGFAVKGRGRDVKIVTGAPRKLLLEGFAATKDGPDRGVDAGTASTMLQAVQAVATNPIVGQTLDASAMLKMLTRVFHLAGAPKDFDLSDLANTQKAPEGQPDQGGAQQVVDTVLQQVEEQIGRPAAEALQMQAQEIQSIKQVLETISNQFVSARTAPPAPTPTQVDATLIPA
jgi:hypothetical protein